MAVSNKSLPADEDIRHLSLGVWSTVRNCRACFWWLQGWPRRLLLSGDIRRLPSSDDIKPREVNHLLMADCMLKLKCKIVLFDI